MYLSKFQQFLRLEPIYAVWIFQSYMFDSYIDVGLLSGYAPQTISSRILLFW